MIHAKPYIPPDGEWRAEKYDFLHRGKWDHIDAWGYTRAKRDFEAIKHLSNMVDGPVNAIIRRIDGEHIWSGINWPPGLRPPPRSWRPAWLVA